MEFVCSAIYLSDKNSVPPASRHVSRVHSLHSSILLNKIMQFQITSKCYAENKMG